MNARFIVTSCTGFKITPGAETGSNGKLSFQGAPKCWQVLDSAIGFRLIGEWSPRGKSGPDQCERTARRFAAALNEWHEAGATEPCPKAPQTTRLSNQEYKQRAQSRVIVEG